MGLDVWQIVIICVRAEEYMPATKMRVREFREKIARFLDFDTPVTVPRAVRLPGSTS